MTQVPTYEDVAKAVIRLEGHAVKTPLLRSDALDKVSSKALWFKAECLQKKNAFKYRGAFNRLSAMTDAEKAKGVVAYSSGNHAQGVSCAAKELGIDVIIVMPTDAPKVKVDGVLADGAKIVTYDRLTESREKMTDEIAKRDGRVIVPSYDNPYVISGQGTIGVELAEAEPDFDAMVTCLGGGGMCAGISLAMKELSPHTRIFGAEPAEYNDHEKSLRAGKRIANTGNPPSLCDAIMTPMPGELTWPINSKSLENVYGITDAECLTAMKLAYEHLGVTLEPGGSVAFAAAVLGKLPNDVETVAVVLSGGNVDPDVWDLAMKSG